jgi:thiol-disulfide isomerase/thioredoxin
VYWRQVLAQTTQPQAASGELKDLAAALGKDFILGVPGFMTQSLSGWEPKKLWTPSGPGRAKFEECAFAQGFDSRADGRSLVAADLDGDGDLELLMLNRGTPKLQLFDNAAQTSGNAVELTLVPKAKGHEGEGTLIRTSRGVFSVALARGFASSVEPRVHLGLGKDAAVEVEVQWRHGVRESFPRLAAGFVHALAEGTGKPVRSVPFAVRPKRPGQPFPSTLEALGLEPSEQVTVVQLFLKGCKPCAEEAPVLNTLFANKQVRVVGLGLHPDGEALAAAAKSLGLTYPVKPLSEPLADALSIAGQLPLPILLVYGKDGTLARVLPGPKALSPVLAELMDAR